MNKSDDIKELAAALCKAQAEMGGADKSKQNPFYDSSYADLSSIVLAIKEPFSNNGLSYSQLTINADGMYGVSTILMHISGQWIGSDFLLPVKKQNDPQAAGSAITYARRYALQAIAGIPSEDDDGNAASKAPKAGPAPITEQDQQWIYAAKADPEVLNQITDATYKARITKLVNK